MKKLLLKPVFGVAFLLLNIAAAFACECPPPLPNQTAEQHRAAFLKEAEEATVIFSGEVVESSLTEAKFRVEKVWKGELKDEVIILTGVKVHEDGSYSRSTCDYGRYHVARRYVVWASGPAGELKAHVCSRTKFLEDAGEDIKTLRSLQASGNEPLNNRRR